MKPTPQLETQITTITPAIAEEWLKNNLHNRAIRRRQVDQLVVAMKSGSWITTHQGIAFDETDELIDGQHRLLAVVESGVTVSMMVTRGIPVNQGGTMTMDVVDFGRPRSVSDSLYLQHGIKNSVGIAAILRGIAKLSNWAFDGTLSVTQSKSIYDIYGKETGIAHQIGSHAPRFIRQSAISAVIAFGLKFDERVEAFGNQLSTGANLTESSPILALRRHLEAQAEIGARNRGQLMQKTSIALVAWIKDKEMKSVRTNSANSGIAYLKHQQIDCVRAVQRILSGGESE